MSLLHEREKLRLAFHKANEDYQAHLAGLSHDQRKNAQLLEEQLHLGLQDPLPAPGSEGLPRRPTTKPKEEPKPPREKTPAQKLKGQEQKLKTKILRLKKVEPPNEEEIAKLEKELNLLKQRRLALQEPGKKGEEEKKEK
jgi:hypothetical protein